MPRDVSGRDYYRTLGVDPTASEDDVRRAYRRLAFQWHPDRNQGNPTASERFKEISEAYAVLADGAKRREYDRARQSGAADPFHIRREDLFRDLFANPRASVVFEELAREFERIGMRVDRKNFQSTLFGGRTVVNGAVVVVTPLTSLFGLGRVVRATFRAARASTEVGEGTRGRTEVGPDRTGAFRPGRDHTASDGTRPLAGGSWLGGLARAGRWLFGLPPAAPANAQASDVVLPLSVTRGEARRGAVRRVELRRNGRTEEVLVKVPAGVRDGTRLRLRGKGHTKPGRPAGDAYLAVQIRE